MTFFRRVSLICLIAVLGTGSFVHAQDSTSMGSKASDGSGGIQHATIQRFVNQAVKGIARRYNLNEAQTTATRELWHREIERFLTENENEVWPVIIDLISQKFQNPKDQHDMQRLGKSAGSLIEPVRKAAVFAQDEFRLLLTAEQKKMHDFDLIEMQKSFDLVRDNLSQWAQGKPTEKGLFPGKQEFPDEPPTPTTPTEGLPPGVNYRIDPSGIFDRIVNQFKKDYELDAAQRDAVDSILSSVKQNWREFRLSKKEEFSKIDSKLRDAHEKRDVAAVRKATKEHKKLLAPLHDMTDLMLVRLKALLTSAQEERFAAGSATAKTGKKPEAKKKPESSTKRLSAKHSKTDAGEDEPDGG